MAASKPINVEDIMTKVWEKFTDTDYNDLITDSMRREIETLISEYAKTISSISNILPGDAPVSELEKLLKPYIADDKMRAMEEAFRKETFTLTIEKSGDTHTAKFHRGGEKFQESLLLTSKDVIVQTRNQQIASLIAEVTFFLLGMAGISLPLSQSHTQQIIAQLLSMVTAGRFGNMINQFMMRWALNNPRQQAMAIYQLIVDIYGLDLISPILQAALGERSLLKKIWTVVEVIAKIAVNLASGGNALVAQIMLALHKTARIGKKVYNLVRSNELQDEMN